MYGTIHFPKHMSLIWFLHSPNLGVVAANTTGVVIPQNNHENVTGNIKHTIIDLLLCIQQL